MDKVLISFDGERIFYKHHKKNDGVTLIFLHGLMANHTQWKCFVEKLNKYNILIPDLRSHGKSTHANVSLKNIAQDIKLIIKKEKLQNYIVIGNCLGANLAIMINSKNNYLINPVSKNIIGNPLISFFFKLVNYPIKLLPRPKKYTFEDYSRYSELPFYYHWLPFNNIKSVDWHMNNKLLLEMVNNKLNYSNITNKSRILYTSKDLGLISEKKLRKYSKVPIKKLKEHHFIITKKPQVIYNDLVKFLKCYQ